MSFEKEVIEAFENMKCAMIEYGEKEISDEAIAILVSAKKQDEMSRKVAAEVCGSIESLQSEYELKLTLQQANAIIDMDNTGWNKGFGLEDEGSCEGWGELLKQAEATAGRKAYGS